MPEPSGWSAAERPQVLVPGDTDGDGELPADLVTTTSHAATATGSPGPAVTVADAGYGTDVRLV